MALPFNNGAPFFHPTITHQRQAHVNVTCGDILTNIHQQEHAVAGKYWLFKSEPGSYSFDDLVKDGVAEWDGVRNFQVRNWLRDNIKPGDDVLFYHSSAKIIGVVGTAKVVREGYPDNTAWDPNSDHPDPKSTPEKPVWYMVDIEAVQKFNDIVTPNELREIADLADMMVLRRAMRFSITPVTKGEFDTVVKMGSAK
jgi:predicted RNA-binding protein with PUA-like domain